MNCRICTHKISSFMSFGDQPIANGFLGEKEFKNEYFFDLAVAFCEKCKMFQLVDQPDPKKMFHENYAFFSSTSKAMSVHFEKLAHHYQEEFLQSSEEPFVVEVGSNDGIMLCHFADKGVKHLGVEPSSNVAAVAKEKGVNTTSEFFGDSLSQKILDEYGFADIISSSNVMCHIPDLNSVGRGVSNLLNPEGVFVFEDPYLGAMISKTSYDQIYDEHVYIFSVQSVANAFAPHGLEVFHVEPQSTHGGSMRYYLCRKGAHPIRPSVRNALDHEVHLGLDQASTYEAFREKCEKNKSDFVGLLKRLKSEGKKVVGYAATSKSTTVLNYCGVGADLIDCIYDTTPLKQGRFSPGMHIPIKPYEDFKVDQPEYVILFAWNHAAEIFEKEKDFAEWGGKWITFVPEVKVGGLKVAP